ncbi:MAG: hypothetical protein ACSLFQ_14515 [Thermoanaerobaculia bacterium]
MDAAPPARIRRELFSTAVIVCLLATLARIVLNRDLAIHAIADAALDDQLFVVLAHNIASGLWLGDYTHATLAKGPGYPIFIGLSSFFRIPLLVAQEALYMAACAALALALRPVTRGRGWAAALYVALLFNPMTWEATELLRLIRQVSYIPFVMIATASVAGCLFHSTAHARRIWMLAGGVSAAMASLTREESIWVAPTIAILALGTLLLRHRVSTPRAFFGYCAGMLAIAATIVGIVSSLNRVSYGVLTVVEFRERSFNDAVGALTRVNPSERLPMVAITRKSRELVYPVSPAFRELRPYLEGDAGRSAVEASHQIASVPGAEDEIFVCWLNWALRDAAKLAGHYDSPLDASAFYRRLADEVNAACDRGVIPCGSPRSGLIPPLDTASFVRASHEARGIGRSLLLLPGVYDRMLRSTGDPSNLRLFASVTRSRLAPIDSDPVTPQSRIRGMTAMVYRGAALVTVAAAPLLAWLAFRRQRRARAISPLSLVAVATASGVAACVALLALMGATSCPGNLPGFFAMPYPFFLVTLWAVAHEGLRRSDDPSAEQAP